MELVSVIASLKEVCKILHHKTESALCTIHSDSKYVVDNWNNSLIKWLDKSWLTSKGGQVVNKQYWELLYHMTCNFKMVKLEWVKGHDNNKYNEIANSIASTFSQKKRRELEKLRLQKKS